MATRPIFIPNEKTIGVYEKPLNFKWHAGMAPSQRRKSAIELHMAAELAGFDKVLEVSSKSDLDLGIKLSAFNLLFKTKKYNNEFSVESAFQGSKVFEKGGPYKELFFAGSISAKKDERLRSSGNLIGFKFFKYDFPLVPRTYFYDWLYINALINNPGLAVRVLDFDGFTDIEFNPKRSVNCQAHAVALYASLKLNGISESLIKNPESFLDICEDYYKKQNRNIIVQKVMI